MHDLVHIDTLFLVCVAFILRCCHHKRAQNGALGNSTNLFFLSVKILTGVYLIWKFSWCRATQMNPCPRFCVMWKTARWCSWTGGTCRWRRALLSPRRARRRSAGIQTFAIFTAACVWKLKILKIQPWLLRITFREIGAPKHFLLPQTLYRVSCNFFNNQLKQNDFQISCGTFSQQQSAANYRSD